MQVARWLHLLGVVVWVGGMFFAHMALRPSVQALDPPQRLPLLATTLSRFLTWVAVAIVLILGSGAYLIVTYGGFAAVAWPVHAMTGLGVVMVLIYAWLVASPFRLLKAGVAIADWPRAGAAMARVRHLVAVNLVLGIVTITVAALGPR
ncbi:MAG: CopD family protein [Burkholderiales bacterium]|nr:CopD family protein [Burkholderiales bacterium]